MSDAKTVEAKKWYLEKLGGMDKATLARELRLMARTPLDFHNWAIEMAKAEVVRREASRDGVELARLVETKLVGCKGWGTSIDYSEIEDEVIEEIQRAARAILAKAEG